MRKPPVALPQSTIRAQTEIKSSAIVTPLPSASTGAISTVEKQDKADADKNQHPTELMESDRWKSLSEDEVFRIARENDIYPVLITTNKSTPGQSKFIGVIMHSIGRVLNKFNHLYEADYNQKVAIGDAVDTPIPKVRDLLELSKIFVKNGVPDPGSKHFAQIVVHCDTGMIFLVGVQDGFNYPSDLPYPHKISNNSERKAAELICLFSG